MITKQRDFIEAAVAAAQDAKELVLPLLMVDTPDDPWTSANLRALQAQREALDPVMAEAVDLLVDFEAPFLDEEVRLAEEGITLSTDMAAFEVAMVEFERAFWQDRFAEHQADPERWDLSVPVHYDVCDVHQLTTADVRRAIKDHGVTSFEELAPALHTSTACSTCHSAVTRLLLQELKRRKEATGAAN